MMQKQSTIRIIFMGKKKTQEMWASIKEKVPADAKVTDDNAVIQQFFSWCVDNDEDASSILKTCYPNEPRWSDDFMHEMHEAVAKENRAPWDELREAELLLKLEKLQYHALYDYLIKLMKQATIDMTDLLCE